MEKEKLVLLDDDDTLHNCPVKTKLVNCLKDVYELIITGPSKNSVENWLLVNHFKKHNGPILIWNNLKPSCVWLEDFCKRFDKRYAFIERNLMPTQRDDIFMLFAGGISFDSINIDPSFFQKDTYEINLHKIKQHYESKNLIRMKPKKKIVFIGQMVWDSTVTYFYNLDSYDALIDKYIKDNNIDLNIYEIIFCKHPILDLRLKDKLDQYPYNCNLTQKYKISNVETIQECLDAEKVVSISSSIIYELMGLGIPVDILGTGQKTFPALRNWKSFDECLSTIMDFQFHIEDDHDHIKNVINRAIQINMENIT